MFQWGMGQMRNRSEQTQVMTKSKQHPVCSLAGLVLLGRTKKAEKPEGEKSIHLGLILMGG